MTRAAYIKKTIIDPAKDYYHFKHNLLKSLHDDYLK